MQNVYPPVMIPPQLFEMTPTTELMTQQTNTNVDPSINLQYAGQDQIDPRLLSQPQPNSQLPEGAMWQQNAKTGDWEVVRDPSWKPQQLFNINPNSGLMPQSFAMGAEPFQGDSQQPSIVSGLFPEVDAMQRALYAQEQQKAMQAQALQYARLSPMEQAQYGLYLGGQQLGSAIGGALGAQDPQLQRISMRNAIMRELDPSNPAQMLQVAQKYAQADPEFAMQIADNARKAAVQVQQANKERQLAVPADIQKAQTISTLEDALDQYKQMPPSPERDRAMKLVESQLKVLKATKETTPAAQLQVATRLAEIAKAQSLLDPTSTEYKILDVEKNQLQRPDHPFTPAAQIQVATRLAEIEKAQAQLSPDSPQYKLLETEKNQLQRPEKSEPRPSVGTDREAFALEEFNTNYYDLTPKQREKVNQRADAESTKKAVASAPKVQVDLKDPTATAKANLDVMGKWEGFLKSGGDVEVANRYKAVKSAVSMANAGNPSADGALLYNIAKMYDPSGAVQEGDKKSITGNPNIPTRFKLLVQGVLEGGSFTRDQRQDLENIASEIVKNKQSQLNVYRKQYVQKNKDLGGSELDILDPYAGLVTPSRAETINQIPTGNTAPNQPQPATQGGKVVKKWSDISK